MQTQNIHRRLAVIVIAALTFMLSTVWTVGAIKGYSGGKLWLVNEPNKLSSYVKYYVNDKQKPIKNLKWVDTDQTGKAVSLSGEGERLEIGYNQLQMHTMTFAGRFFWRGAAKGQEEETMYSQRLFTLSRNDDTWLSVMPHAKNLDKPDKNGKVLDGVYMAFSMGSGNSRVFYEFMNPAAKGQESYGLQLNQWHHIAMTMDGQNLRLYIDGRLWFEKMLILGVEEMRNNTLSIGGGRWNDPTLNALIDDMAVYDHALSAKQIAELGGATSTKNTTTKSPSSSNKTSEDALDGTTGSGGAAGTLFGLPLWTIGLAGGLLLFFAALSLLLSLNKPDLHNDPLNQDGKGEDKL